jgi:hypothetical protein
MPGFEVDRLLPSNILPMSNSVCWMRMIILACNLDLEIEGHCEVHNTLQLMWDDDVAILFTEADV